MLRNGVLLLAWVCVGLPCAMAQPVKICIADEAYIPFSFPEPEREGPGQYLARLAITKQNGTAVFIDAPWRRCLWGVRQGDYDAILGAAANPSFFEFMAFPMKEGKPDARCAAGSTTFVALRRMGSKASWDGEKFSDVHMPVLYGAGIVVVKNKLEKLGVPADDSAKWPIQTLRMLMRERADIIVTRLYEAQALLQEPEFKHKLEILPEPFVAFDGYLAVGRPVYERNPEFFEKVWTEMGRLHSSKDVQKIMQKLLSP